MPSADQSAVGVTETADEVDEPAGPVDEARSALLEALTDEMGDAFIGSHLQPGRNLWIRVTNESWSATADYLRNRQRFRLFDWLSAIDWMPSPFGRSLDAAVDTAAEDSSEAAGSDSQDDDGLAGTGADGVTGGATRFQMLARVYNLSTGLGLNLKADLPEADDGSPAIGTWTASYPGAAWHEREAHEMFGIVFTGNGDLRNLYLPSDFEGYPLRKDYPLLARLVKPWPGIIDVEQFPEVDAPSADNPEDAS